MMFVATVFTLFFLLCPFALAADLPSFLKDKERHASLIFRGIKSDKLIFDSTLESESTDRIITEVFYIPLSNMRSPTLQALTYGDIVPVLVAPEGCFQTSDVTCATAEDAAALLLAPAANTICGNVRVRGQATLTFYSDLTLYAFSSYTSISHLVSEVDRELETSPGEDCLYTVDFWWGTVTCDSPGGPCTKIKTRQKHIMEEKCTSSSAGASACASGGVGKAPKFCGTVEYKTSSWSRSSSETEEHAFGGTCKKVGNACVCELSAAGHTAFQTWFNEPLPAPACAGGAGACPNQKCPSSVPSPVPAPAPSLSPAPYPAPAPASSVSPAPYPVPTPTSSLSPAPYPFPAPVSSLSPAPYPVPAPESVPSVVPMVTPTPQETPQPTPAPAPTTETSPPVPTEETAPPTPVPAPTSETSPPVPTEETAPPTPVPAPTGETSPPVPTEETAPPTQVPAPTYETSPPVPTETTAPPSPVPVAASSSPVPAPTIGTPPPSPTPITCPAECTCRI